jgi:carbamoyl-phosphate synthase/aspartate carbamoyltransferase/dihydroorotase
MITLPGLVDIQTHITGPKTDRNENWFSLTSAALAGGITTILTMPDSDPMITDEATLDTACSQAAEMAVCDFGQVVAATVENVRNTKSFEKKAAAILLHFPELKESSVLNNMHAINRVFSSWPNEKPICIDGNVQQIGSALFTAKVHDASIHVYNVSTREQIELIREAKGIGTNVSCSVSPHHLFLSQKHLKNLPADIRAFLPALGTEDDRRAIWKNLDLIDCFTSDHSAYQQIASEDGSISAGYPGLETALALYLHAVKGGFLTLEDMIARCYTNPKRIFHLPDQMDTIVEIDSETPFRIEPAIFKSKGKWSPYANLELIGKVTRVTIRGVVVFENGEILAKPGSGLNVVDTKEVLI